MMAWLQFHGLMILKQEISSAGWTSFEAAGAPTSYWEAGQYVNNTSGGSCLLSIPIVLMEFMTHI